MVSEEFTGALSALTHETRVQILRALADADDALSFTELKSRVDVADPGRFNYHLRELRDHFVAERDGGYALTYRGEGLVVAGASGVSVDESQTAAEPSSCPVCGEEDCDRLVHVHLAADR
ncbi:winged helix-turn-helix domain-containing protein [Halorubrum sp. RMP-47]|uniref:Winged helix-turn-helix domain-containing protein n=1 Tax=Halorubrum miltondacostae TaxID=3076378 RepID=A0ABD5M178_9EURY